MKLLSLFVLGFALVAAFLAQRTGDIAIILLAATAFLCAATTFLSSRISAFLKIFAAIFATELIVFGTLYLISAAGLWPAGFEDYRLPDSLPLTVAIFAILVYAVSFIPVMRKMMTIADRYFVTADRGPARIWPLPAFVAFERRVAVAMIVFLVLINQAQVGITVRLSFFSRDWFNAIQAKDAATFWHQILYVFTPWAFILVGSYFFEFVVQSTLVIKWRRWLTNFYTNHWLDGHAHYRMALVSDGADNPDQRISEDIYRFIDGGLNGGSGIYTFTIALISSLSSLVSFAIILWVISDNFTLPYTTIVVPGYLFWVVLLYAGIGTALTHLIGHTLARLSFERQRYEADFRFSLARLREYTEQVALLNGEPAEKASLGQRFGTIIRNYFEIVDVRKRLLAFTQFYGQISPIIPFVVAAPFYFLGRIELGIMTQTATAFGRVDASLTFFVTNYVSLAEFKSVLDRLLSFDAAIDAAHALDTRSGQGKLRGDRGATFGLENLVLNLPDGRTIVESGQLQFIAKQSLLIVGPSGSGKSTLFRAISGIWPFGKGKIEIPKGARIMLLPQKPYLPNGTLRAALTYPAAPDAFDDATVHDALVAAKLDGFVDKLDIDDVWSRRMSGGEQERLSIARALLAKPDWLFLDEATASMDEPMEAAIYQILKKRLPDTTIVSIGHRSSLLQFHDRRIVMSPTGGGPFSPSDLAKEPAK
jgi:vitamin B12/bleomycin/antimicrobial peptide transport system ATP-binding/permease protein